MNEQDKLFHIADYGDVGVDDAVWLRLQDPPDNRDNLDVGGECWLRFGLTHRTSDSVLVRRVR